MSDDTAPPNPDTIDAIKEANGLMAEAMETYNQIGQDMILCRMTERMTGMMMQVATIQMLKSQAESGHAAKQGLDLDVETLTVCIRALVSTISTQAKNIAETVRGMEAVRAGYEAPEAPENTKTH